MSLTRLIACAVMFMVLVGCASSPSPDGGQPEVVIPRGPVPAYEDVAVAVNARAEALERISAFATLHVWFLNEHNKEEEEQFEVTVMLAHPDRVYMRFRLATVNLAILGSDEHEFWWVNIKDERRAWLGSHENATPAMMAQFVFPIHPLDFVEMLGMSSIPATQNDATLAWTEDGRYLSLETSSRFGRRRTLLDPVDGQFIPARIELLDDRGDIAIEADLTKYEWTELARGEPDQNVPTEIHFRLADGHTRARFRPNYDSSNRVRDRAFDRAQLFQAYRIDPEDVILLDEQVAGADDGVERK